MKHWIWIIIVLGMILGLVHRAGRLIGREEGRLGVEKELGNAWVLYYEGPCYKCLQKEEDER